MFPAFGFGAQIPPTFQVMEYVNALQKTRGNAYSGGNSTFNPDSVFCVLIGVT